MKAYLLLALLVVCIFPSIASSQTAEEIIERNIAARGGAEKLRAIHSMKVTTVDEASLPPVPIIRPDTRSRYAVPLHLLLSVMATIFSFGWIALLPVEK